jgi:ribosomal protein S18 acetylase RimI-like enzyme
MSVSWHFRPLTAADLPCLSEISSKARFGAPWNQQKLAVEIQEADSLALVETSSALILAFVFFRRLQGEGGLVFEISWLATNPAHLRQGFMSLLLQALVDAESQLTEIWLEVHENNKEARNLYEKWGFRTTSLRPRYYADGGAAELMSRRFT